MKRAAAFMMTLVLGALAASGCEDNECTPNETLVVDEVGTCSATPRRFTLAVEACRVGLDQPQSVTGLPGRGSVDPLGAPLRQGGFLLYSTDSEGPFRLCRARRVEFRLELSCVDGSGAPLCQATLTEPGP